MTTFGIEAGAPAPALLKLYPKMTAWSFSSVSAHQKCPLALRLRRIDRLPEPESPALTNGSERHLDMQHYLVHGRWRDGTPLPLQAWDHVCDELRALGGQAEVQQGFDAQWRPCEWYAPNVWVRVVFDVVRFDAKARCVHVTEWKTGRAYPEHIMQLRLYALAGLAMHPHALEARAQVHYLDRPLEAGPNYTAQRRVVPDLQREFADFSREFLNDQLYPARPSPRCRWCHFRANGPNGGPCHIVA